MEQPTFPCKRAILYTDGACLDNPGPGGYGVVLLANGHQRELSGGYRHTTNNRMELRAAIAGLEALPGPCRVTLYSDSALLVRAMEEGWLQKWKRKGWKRGRKWVQNADLWQRLDALCGEHEVRFVWVKGHAGNPGNERADTLSLRAAQSSPVAIDEAYEAGETERKPKGLFD